MPERDKAVSAAARTMLGVSPRRWDENVDDCPQGVEQAVWDDARADAERIYVYTVENVDWQRILIQARGRHRAVHPAHAPLLMAAEIGMESFEDICDECLREVLLATGTHPDWAQQPDSPRYVLYEPPPVGELLVPPEYALRGDEEPTKMEP